VTSPHIYAGISGLCDLWTDESGTPPDWMAMNEATRLKVFDGDEFHFAVPTVVSGLIDTDAPWDSANYEVFQVRIIEDAAMPDGIAAIGTGPNRWNFVSLLLPV